MNTEQIRRTTLRRIAAVILITTIAVAATTEVPAQAKIGSTLPNFKLADQKKRTWRRTNFASKPVLYVACDREAYDYVDNWTKQLVPKYRNDIHFVPIADLSTAPDFLKGYIRDRFDDEFTYPVLMDWAGKLVKLLGIKEGYPTLVITTAAGKITYQAWGKGSASQVGRLDAKLAEITGK